MCISLTNFRHTKWNINCHFTDTPVNLSSWRASQCGYSWQGKSLFKPISYPSVMCQLSQMMQKNCSSRTVPTVLRWTPPLCIQNVLIHCWLRNSAACCLRHSVDLHKSSVSLRVTPTSLVLCFLEGLLDSVWKRMAFTFNANKSRIGSDEYSVWY